MLSVFMINHQSPVRCDSKPRSPGRAIEDKSRERQAVGKEVHIGIVAAGCFISTCGTAPVIIIAAI